MKINSASSGGIFDVDSKRRRIEELESISAEPGFWDDRNTAEGLLREANAAKSMVSVYDQQVEALTDALTLFELAMEVEDVDSMNEVRGCVDAITTALADLEFRRMLSGEGDAGGAIVEINSGAGGVDASDWAQMVLRMMTRYCQRKGWKTQMIDEQGAEEAGIKSATFAVDGEFAYGLLKAETGVHRLVRISPFDSNARRHTSFASVKVSPDVDDSIEIEVIESELRIDFYRAGGGPADNTSTRPRVRCALPIFPQEPWPSVKMNDPNTKTKRRQCEY